MLSIAHPLAWLRVVRLMVIGFTLWTLGCTGSQQRHDDLVKTYSAASPTAQKGEIEALNQKLFATANVNADPSDTLLGPGDLLEGWRSLKPRNLQPKYASAPGVS